MATPASHIATAGRRGPSSPPGAGGCRATVLQADSPSTQPRDSVCVPGGYRYRYRTGATSLNAVDNLAQPLALPVLEPGVAAVRAFVHEVAGVGLVLSEIREDVEQLVREHHADGLRRPGDPDGIAHHGPAPRVPLAERLGLEGRLAQGVFDEEYRRALRREPLHELPAPGVVEIPEPAMCLHHPHPCPRDHDSTLGDDLRGAADRAMDLRDLPSRATQDHHVEGKVWECADTVPPGWRCSGVHAPSGISVTVSGCAEQAPRPAPVGSRSTPAPT